MHTVEPLFSDSLFLTAWARVVLLEAVWKNNFRHLKCRCVQFSQRQVQWEHG
jgi:hypothetical protein